MAAVSCGQCACRLGSPSSLLVIRLPRGAFGTGRAHGQGTFVGKRDIERWFADQQASTTRRREVCASKRWFATEAEARAAALWDRTQFGEHLTCYRWRGVRWLASHRWPSPVAWVTSWEEMTPTRLIRKTPIVNVGIVFVFAAFYPGS